MCQAYEGYEPYNVLKRTPYEVHVCDKCENFFIQQVGQDTALSLNMLRVVGRSVQSIPGGHCQ